MLLEYFQPRVTNYKYSLLNEIGILCDVSVRGDGFYIAVHKCDVSIFPVCLSHGNPILSTAVSKIYYYSW